MFKKLINNGLPMFELLILSATMQGFVVHAFA